MLQPLQISRSVHAGNRHSPDCAASPLRATCNTHTPADSAPKEKGRARALSPSVSSWQRLPAACRLLRPGAERPVGETPCFDAVHKGRILLVVHEHVGIALSGHVTVDSLEVPFDIFALVRIIFAGVRIGR